MNNVKLLVLASLFSIFTINTAFSQDNPPPLDEVSFTLTAQEWAKTDKAKVTIAVNAALDKMALAKMREQIMSNLNKIAKGNWHITDFERSQDSSGLEKLYVEAEARINETALTNVNAQAQDVSQAGITYKVLNIDFTPSIADIEKVKKTLRDTIYHQAQTELTTLNTLYPEQKYAVHTLHFGEYTSLTSARTQVMMMSGDARPQSNVAANAVSNLVTLTADVNLASERT